MFVCLLALACVPPKCGFSGHLRESFKYDKKIQVRAWRTAPPLTAMLTALFHSLLCPLLPLSLRSCFAFFLLILKLLLFLNCMLVFCLHICVYLVPKEVRKGCQMSWNWSFRWLWDNIWELGLKSRSSGQAGNALNCWAFSLAPLALFSTSIPVYQRLVYKEQIFGSGVWNLGKLFSDSCICRSSSLAETLDRVPRWHGASRGKKKPSAYGISASPLKSP